MNYLNNLFIYTEINNIQIYYNLTPRQRVWMFEKKTCKILEKNDLIKLKNRLCITAKA